MLYQSLFNVAKQYPNKMALNNLSYAELVEKINHHPYRLVSNGTGEEIILDVFRASQLQKPITILPIRTDNIEQVTLDDRFYLILYSSGSTSSIRKPIMLTEEMILSNAYNAIKSQSLTENDIILTVCSLHHTGGLNAQTIPGLLVGAHIIIEPFNINNFFEILSKNNVTVTHVIPKMTDVLLKSNKNNGHQLRTITTGSDCVYKHHISYWLNYSHSVITNYGLTQAGPILINHQFFKDSDLGIFDQGVILGSNIWCDYKIQDNELIVNGSNVISPWFHTDDCVEKIDNWFIYKGRKSAGCKIIPKKY